MGKKIEELIHLKFRSDFLKYFINFILIQPNVFLFLFGSVCF